MDDQHNSSSILSTGGQDKEGGRLGLDAKQADWKLSTEAKAPVSQYNAQQEKVITGEIFPNLLNTQVGKYEEFMGDADVLVPETILERPRRRLKSIEKLREDIMTATEEVQQKIILIYQLLHDNVYNDQTDEGYLETDIELYEKCFHVELETVQQQLDDEVYRLRNEYKRAQEESKNLIEQMETFLKQNHTIVQDFLKTTHKAIVTLSKPAAPGNTLNKQVQKRFQQSESVGGDRKTFGNRRKTFQDSAQSMIRPSISANTAGIVDGSSQDFWVPTLKKMQAFGPVYQNKFEWPSLSVLNKYDLSKQITLAGIELGASSNLYGLRLHFTNQISSPYVRASETREQDYQRHDIDPKRRVSDIYISQDSKSGNIQGFRLVDESGNFLVDQLWNKFNDFAMQQQNIRWKHFRIPTGYSLIGVYGSDDGTFIKSIGFIVWQPNPQAITNRAAQPTIPPANYIGVSSGAAYRQ